MKVRTLRGLPDGAALSIATRVVAHWWLAVAQRGHTEGVRILEMLARRKRWAVVAQAVGYGALQVLLSLLRGCTEDMWNCNEDMALAALFCLDALLCTPQCAGARMHVTWIAQMVECGVTEQLEALEASPLMSKTVRCCAVRARKCRICVSIRVAVCQRGRAGARLPSDCNEREPLCTRSNSPSACQA